MAICFDIESNTKPTVFTAPGFDHYVSTQSPEGLPSEQHALLSPTATVAQLDGAYFSIKPLRGELTETHLQDLTRNEYYTVFGIKNPTLARLKQVFTTTCDLKKIALGNMFKAGLFSQHTFLFSIKQSIDTRIFQLEKEQSRMFPVGLNTAIPTIEISDTNDGAFIVSYTNSLCYREYLTEDATQGSKVKISGWFTLAVKFSLTAQPTTQECFINTYSHSFPYNIPYISLPNPYPVLQAKVVCAEYNVDAPYVAEMQRLGFKQLEFSTPKSSCSVSRGSMVSPSSPSVRQTLQAVAEQLSNREELFAKLPSSLPASRSGSNVPSRACSRDTQKSP